MIFKLESSIKKVRWKAIIYEKSGNLSKMIVNNFESKSVRTPIKNGHLLHLKLNCMKWYVSLKLGKLG